MKPAARPRRSQLVIGSLLVGSLAVPFRVPAQNEDMQQRISELKESIAKNKQVLATYTWHETDTVKLKGETKKVSNFQVRMGPDGKPQKTLLDAPAQPQQQPAQTSRGGGRLKERVVEKKKEELKDYGENMKTLAAQYLPPDKDKIQAAAAAGKVSLSPEGSDAVRIVFKDYLKAGDSMTLTFNKTAKRINSLAIVSWMDDPKDVMNLTVEFSKLPDGTNYSSSVTIDGVAKQLMVIMQNSDYKKL